MPEFSYVGLTALVARAETALTAAVNQAANDLVQRSAAAAPVKTGTLRASIHTDGAHAAGTEVSAKVSTGGEADAYAVFVHEGTGPHTIEGHPFLAFNGIVVRSVQHPGTKATKFMEGPLLQMAGTYRDYISAAAATVF
jgi:hypothetical protein